MPSNMLAQLTGNGDDEALPTNVALGIILAVAFALVVALRLAS